MSREPLLMQRASRGDVEALVRLREGISAWLAGRGIRQWVVGDFPEERMAEWVEAGYVYVHRRDGEPVAAVAVMWSDPDIWGPDDGDAGYIHLLMVDRALAGQGLGDRVLSFAERLIVEAGRGLARLDAVSGNEPLHRWYAERGYVEVGPRSFSDGKWFDTTLRQKRLQHASTSPPAP